MAETLKEKTAKGLFWGAMNNGAMQVIGLVFGIILGRLLSKEDYGMMAMINVFPPPMITTPCSGLTSSWAVLFMSSFSSVPLSLLISIMMTGLSHCAGWLSSRFSFPVWVRLRLHSSSRT